MLEQCVMIYLAYTDFLDINQAINNITHHFFEKLPYDGMDGL